jgi:CO dehydrogenase/acetyl-CoA synthase beta subunit
MRSILLSAIAGACLAYNEYNFVSYIATHNKHYDSIDEFKVRFAKYLEADKVIKEHNSSQDSYRLAHNKFSDRTEEEMQKFYGDVYVDESKHKRAPKVNSDGAFPTGAINWIDAGCVNPIQDQGSCGSCWAFSAVASMEGAECVKHS